MGINEGPTYDFICRGDLAPGVLPADIALYLLGQVGPGTLSGGTVRFSGNTLSGLSPAEEQLFVETAEAMGASAGIVNTGAAADGTAVVDYDFSSLEPQVVAGARVQAVAEARRPFVSAGYLGDVSGRALEAVKKILAGREVYYDCVLYGVSPELAEELKLRGAHDGGAPQRPAEFPVIATHRAPCTKLAESGTAVFVASAATVAASMLTGRAEDPTRLFKKKGRPPRRKKT